MRIREYGIDEGLCYQPWADLARKGVGVHCGEGNAFNKTPIEIVLK
jgi:hypothetical protein